MAENELHSFLRVFVSAKPPGLLEELALTEPGPWEENEALTTDEVHEQLLRARERGLIHGRDQHGDGSVVWWSGLRLTVAGLHEIGEWPPPGHEFVRGPWDQGIWGQEDKQVLADIEANSTAHGPSYFDDDPGWASVVRLQEAGLIRGEPDLGAMTCPRSTSRARKR